jgi:hypothetical protein
MGITDKLLEIDTQKLYRNVDKLPLSAWFSVLSLTGRGADNAHNTTIRLIQDYGLGLYTKEDSKLNVSIEEIEEALNEVNDLLFNTDDHENKIFHQVTLGRYSLGSVYVK